MHEREADELDQASQAALEDVETTISVIRAQLHGETTTVCIDCGQEIPPERLAAAARNGMAVQRCIHCAELEERRHSLFPDSH